MMEQKIISKNEFFAIIARELFNGVIHEKSMLIDTTNDMIESAISPIIDDIKYGIQHFKIENKFRFLIWKFTKEQSEPMFRQVQLSYDDILQNVMQFRGGTVIDVADRMYKTLLEISKAEWETILQKMEKSKKPSIQL